MSLRAIARAASSSMSPTAAIVILALAGGCGRSAPAPVAPTAPAPAVPTPPVAPAEAPATDAPRCVSLASSVLDTLCPCPDEAACAARCEQGSGSDCGALGVCWGKRISSRAPDAAKYARYAKIGCELGDATACTNLGDVYRLLDTPEDARLADEAFKRALVGHRAGCDAGRAGACYMVGDAYRKGRGVPVDAAQAEQLDGKSCALGGMFSCVQFTAAALFARHYEEQITRAAPLCELACSCEIVIDGRRRGSPAAARVVAGWKARCARGDRAACAAAETVEKTPAGLPLRARFTGNRAFTSEELDAEMTFDKLDGPLASGASQDEVIERDALHLAAFYYDHGYLEYRGEPPSVSPAPDGAFTDVSIHLDEGTRYHVGKVVVVERDPRGKPMTPLGRKDLRGTLSLKEGDWFDRSMVVRALGTLRGWYGDAGYGNVEVTPETSLDRGRAVVDLTITVHRGPLVHFEHIAILGNVRVPTARIQRELRLKEGMLCNVTQLDEAKKRLQALSLFKEVHVSMSAKPDATRWTVSIEVTE